MQSKEKVGRLAGADGLRAIACLMIVLGHSIMNSWDLQEDWLSAFGLGVGIFFILSGLLLSVPFWIARQSALPMPSLKNYFVNRLARIMPAYFVCLIFCYFAFSDYSRGQTAEMLIGLIFMNGFHYRSYFPVEVNYALWSIGVEMIFYVMLAIWVIGLFYLPRKLPPMAYWLMTVVSLLGGHVLLTNEIGEQIVKVPPNFRYQLAAEWLPERNPISLFIYFLFGVASGAIYVGLRSKTYGVDAHAGRFGRYRYDYAALALFGLATIIAVPSVLHVLPAGSFVANMIVASTWDQLPFAWPLFPISIMLLLAILPFTCLVGRLLDNRMLSVTAKLSLGIYLWHMPIMHMFKEVGLASDRTSPPQAVLFLILATTASYFIAYLSLRYIEQPMMNWARHRSLVPSRKA